MLHHCRPRTAHAFAAAEDLRVVVVSKDGNTSSPWNVVRVVPARSGVPVADLVRPGRESGYGCVAATFTADGMQLLARPSNQFAQDVVRAHPAPFTLEATRLLLDDSVADTTAISANPNEAHEDRERSKVQLAYLLLVQSAYRGVDRHARSLALAVIDAGFTGTADELERAVTTSLTPA